MRWLGLLVACVAVGLVAADAPKELQGTWTVTKMEQGGKERPESVGDTLTVDGEKFIVKNKEGKERFTAAVKVDAAKKPPTVDLTEKRGDKEVTVPGIYKLDGDTLTFCFPMNPDKDNTRPKEIAVNENTMVVTLKREKK